MGIFPRVRVNWDTVFRKLLDQIATVCYTFVSIELPMIDQNLRVSPSCCQFTYIAFRKFI
jgi:hypothetical protein